MNLKRLAMNQSPKIKLEIDPARNSILFEGTEGETILSEPEMKNLIGVLHNVSYDSKTDIFNLPAEMIFLGERLGVK